MMIAARMPLERSYLIQARTTRFGLLIALINGVFESGNTLLVNLLFPAKNSNVALTLTGALGPLELHLTGM